MIYKIKFYDSDHGGMRIELKKTKIFQGTYKQAGMFVESERSPWGFYYKVGEYVQHGVATITKLNDKIYFLENKILELQQELEEEYALIKDI